MHFYYSYQQLFVSDLKLSIPELSGDDSMIQKIDAIRIRLFDSTHEAPPIPADIPPVKEYAYLNALNVGVFIVSQGVSVEIYPLDGVSDEILEMWIFGIVMSTLMYQRGFFTLHACAMQVGNKTIALIGDVGYGKSTLTASLLVRGHKFLADDLTVLDFHSGRPCVLPGFPILKLTREVAERTGFGPDRQLGQHPYKGKSIYCVDLYVDDNAPQLDYLFLLDRGSLEFKPLHALESFIQLNSNSLPTGRGLRSERQHFERCALISRRIPFIIFRRPFNMEDLGEQAKYLENFLESGAPQYEVTDVVKCL